MTGNSKAGIGGGWGRVMAGMVLALSAIAMQGQAAASKGVEQTELLKVKNVVPLRESSDVVKAMRNALEPGGAKLTLVASENEILVKGSGEQVAAARTLLGELDQPNRGGEMTETLRLQYATDPHGANEVMTALRNMLDPSVRIYLVPTQDVIAVHATPEQMALTKRLLGELDRPRKSYRLRYTLTDTDGEKRVGVQHFDVVVVAGERTTLKQGSKVPVVTGSYSQGGNGRETQVTYLDVGINIEVAVDEAADGVRLRTKVERSSVAEETAAAFGTQDPVIRQTVVEGTANLVEGKPLIVGSTDVVGSTRHLDVSVLAEAVR